jgi:hypothetical protein
MSVRFLFMARAMKGSISGMFMLLIAAPVSIKPWKMVGYLQQSWTVPHSSGGVQAGSDVRGELRVHSPHVSEP